MSTRQYIGARYVPKFFSYNGSTEWVSGFAYEALTIVTRNGNSYTSKVPVPSNVGAPEDNPDYWAETGIYNAQIDSYRQEVEEVQEDIVEVQGDIKEVQGDVENIEKDISNSVKSFSGKTIAPVYIGDVITEITELPSAVCGNGNLIYFLTAYDNTDNTGVLRIINRETNQITTTKTVFCGHGNSLCYNATDRHFYIAPVFDKSGGKQVQVHYIIKYDSSFSSYELINTPSNFVAMGVSYDTATDKMYVFNYQNIYEYVGGEFVLVKKVLETLDDGINQDIAVYNNNYYISRPDGSFIYGALDGNEYFVANVFRMDRNARFYLGELEGWEFINGMLTCVMYTVLSNCIDAFILDLPVNETFPLPYLHENYGRTNYTYALTAETQGKFCNQVFELKTLNQLRCLTEHPSRIEIVDAVETHQVVFGQDVMIDLNGSLTVPAIRVRNGRLTVGAAAANKSLIFTTSGFQISENSELFLGTTNPIIVTLGSHANDSAVLVQADYKSHVVVNYLPTSNAGVTFCINSTAHKLLQGEEYYGDKYANTVVGGGGVGATIAADALYSDEVSVSFPCTFQRVPTVILTPTTSETTPQRVFIGVITELTASGFKFRAWRLNQTGTLAATNPYFYWAVIPRDRTA